MRPALCLEITPEWLAYAYHTDTLPPLATTPQSLIEQIKDTKLFYSYDGLTPYLQAYAKYLDEIASKAGDIETILATARAAKPTHYFWPIELTTKFKTFTKGSKILLSSQQPKYLPSRSDYCVSTFQNTFYTPATGFSKMGAKFKPLFQVPTLKHGLETLEENYTSVIQYPIEFLSAQWEELARQISNLGKLATTDVAAYKRLKALYVRVSGATQFDPYYLYLIKVGDLEVPFFMDIIQEVNHGRNNIQFNLLSLIPLSGFNYCSNLTLPTECLSAQIQRLGLPYKCLRLDSSWSFAVKAGEWNVTSPISKMLQLCEQFGSIHHGPTHEELASQVTTKFRCSLS
jgi:hypothetical protein